MCPPPQPLGKGTYLAARPRLKNQPARFRASASSSARRLRPSGVGVQMPHFILKTLRDWVGGHEIWFQAGLCSDALLEVCIGGWDANWKEVSGWRELRHLGHWGLEQTIASTTQNGALNPKQLRGLELPFHAEGCRRWWHLWRCQAIGRGVTGPPLRLAQSLCV